jgi:Ser/Thr protein kinase RdoA (MazF antagonist)
MEGLYFMWRPGLNSPGSLRDLFLDFDDFCAGDVVVDAAAVFAEDEQGVD